MALLLEKRRHISEPNRGVYWTFVTDNVPWLASLFTQEEFLYFLVFSFFIKPSAWLSFAQYVTFFF